MAACPWCKAQVGDPLAPCPRCGRRSDEKVAITEAGGVPDLDLPVRPSRTFAAPKAPAVAASPSVRSMPASAAAPVERENNAHNDPGARTILDDSDSSGGSLDLDLTGPPLIAPTSGRPPPAPAQTVASAGVKGSLAPAAAKASLAPAASTAMAKRERPAASEDIDPYEARALADYGDPPAEWWRAPLYAYRVLRRRPELKKVAAQKRRDAERASGAAEDALFAFAELARPIAERLAAYGPAFDSVRAAERVLGERDAILASETASHKQRQAEIDTKLAELEGNLSKVQGEERMIAAELAEADALLKRAEARVKRIEIEMRAAVAQAAGETPEGAKGPGP
jgi:hypothetical protein